MELALNNGWRKVKGYTCENDGKFNGYRMVKNDNYAITPLYDEKGTISGVQVNVSHLSDTIIGLVGLEKDFLLNTQCSSSFFYHYSVFLLSRQKNSGTKVGAVRNTKPVQIR